MSNAHSRQAMLRNTVASPKKRAEHILREEPVLKSPFSYGKVSTNSPMPISKGGHLMLSVQ